MAAGDKKWSGIVLDPATFDRFLSSHGLGTDGADISEARREELFLACACAEGDRRAHEIFEAEFLRPAVQAVAQKYPSVEAAELMQSTRQRLLMPRAGSARPRIASFAGRGDLLRWTRAAATRAALDLLGSSSRIATVSDEGLLDALAATDDHPEGLQVRASAQEVFKGALREAVASLESRERAWLQHYYLDGLKLESIAETYGVAASTVHRALLRARATLLLRVRKTLRERHRLTDGDVDSLVRVVQSRFELTGGRLSGKPQSKR